MDNHGPHYQEHSSHWGAGQVVLVLLSTCNHHCGGYNTREAGSRIASAPCWETQWMARYTQDSDCSATGHPWCNPHSSSCHSSWLCRGREASGDRWDTRPGRHSLAFQQTRNRIHRLALPFWSPDFWPAQQTSDQSKIMWKDWLIFTCEMNEWHVDNRKQEMNGLLAGVRFTPVRRSLLDQC